MLGGNPLAAKCLVLSIQIIRRENCHILVGHVVAARLGHILVRGAGKIDQKSRGLCLPTFTHLVIMPSEHPFMLEHT